MRILTALVVGFFGFLALYFLSAMLIPSLIFSLIMGLLGGGTFAALVLTSRRSEVTA
jgi:hypothetical protein